MDALRLPGGLGVERKRSYRFKPVTGALELVLSESRINEDPLPIRVTDILAAAVSHIGDTEAEKEDIESLCIEDRQFLMRRLSIRMGMDHIWLSHDCRHCRNRFDIEIFQSELPIAPAKEGFPETEVSTRFGRCRFRAVNGNDQARLLDVENEAQARQRLSSLCLISVENETIETVPEFGPEDCEMIEQALEELAPKITTDVVTHCPECHTENIVLIDPYLYLEKGEENIFDEIHQLAIHYHWAETEILALPRERRKRYLRLIDRSRGVTS